jgi:hypothetical protein
MALLLLHGMLFVIDKDDRALAWRRLKLLASGAGPT